MAEYETVREMDSYKFSIIVPCYNSESYLHTAIQSIINQTYPNWELIAVNDGSKDNTLAILNAYAEADSRIRVFSKPNGGYVSAVNLGLEKITGDYFLMMGSDDRISESLFEEISIRAQQSDPDCVAFRTVKVQDGVVLGIDRMTDFSYSAFSSNTSFYDFNCTYPKESAIFSCRDSSKCWKRKLLGDLKYWGKYGMDADGIFSMLLCHRASSFMFIPVDGYFWTLRSDSLSGRKTFYEQEWDRVDIWTRFYNALYAMNLGNITDKETGYLYIFAEILANFWKSSPLSPKAYMHTRKASTIIKQMLKRYKFNMLDFLSGSFFLMVHAPVLWRLYMILPKEIKALLKRKGD